jgi:hypothetical protein
MGMFTPPSFNLSSQKDGGSGSPVDGIASEEDVMPQFPIDVEPLAWSHGGGTIFIFFLCVYTCLTLELNGKTCSQKLPAYIPSLSIFYMATTFVNMVTPMFLPGNCFLFLYWQLYMCS